MTERKVSKWLLWVFVLLLIGGCQIEYSADEYIARAESFISKEEIKSAEIELKNALKQEPKNAQARYMLGKLYSDIGAGAAAEKELEVALELGVARDSIILPYARALSLQKKNRKILDEVAVIETLEPLQKAELHVYRGTAYFNTGKAEKAEVEFRSALAQTPDFPLAVLGLAKIALVKGKFSQSMRLVDQAIQSDPELPVLWEYKADLYESKGQLQEAIDSYDRALGKESFNPRIYAKRATSKARLGQLDAALEDIAKAHKATPEFFLAFFADGLVKLQRNKYEEAKTAFELALKSNENYRPSYYFLGLVNLNQKELFQAEKNLKQFLYGYPGSKSGMIALAAVQFRLGEYEAAQNSLAPVLRVYPDDPQANQLAASVAFASGKPEVGITYLNQIAGVQPDDLLAKGQLGVAQLMYGDRVLGVNSLVEVLKAKPEIEGLEVVIANAWIKEKNYLRAQLWIDKIRKRYPSEYSADAMQGYLLLAQGNRAAAIDSFNKALAIKPGDYAVSDKLANMYVAVKKYDHAEQVYRNVLEVHKDHPFAYMDLARIKAMTGDGKGMEQLLKRVIAIYPKESSPRVMLAKYYMRQGNNTAAEELLDTDLPDNQKTVEYLISLRQAQWRNGKPDQAKSTAVLLTQKFPGSEVAHYQLALAEKLTGDHDAARTSLGKSLQIFPEYVPSRLLLGELMILADQHAEAKKLVVQLQEELPDDLNVAALAAQYHVAAGQHREASQIYKKIHGLKPGSKSIVDLAWSTHLSDDTDSAEKLLTEWLAQYPADAQARLSLVRLYNVLGRGERAAAELQVLSDMHQENAVILNELAWQLYQNGQFEKAHRFAEKAYQKIPNSVEIRDTYGVTLLETGKVEQAVEMLGSVASDRPNIPSFRFHYAQALARSGKVKSAVSQLESALDMAVYFPERKAANALLEKLSQ